MSGLAAYYPLWERFLDKLPEIITATWETLDMVLLSTLFSLISGFLLAILMGCSPLLIILLGVVVRNL